MQWVRFSEAGVARAGFHRDGEIVVVEGDEILPLLIGEREPVETGESHSIGDVELLAPLVPVRNVMCVGWNYLPHFEEGAVIHGERELPSRPSFFSKTTTTVAPPFADVPAHGDVTAELDYEVELGVVIGRRVSNLSEQDALDAVAGYVVAQDISARDLQRDHGGQWFKGKGLDGTCPLGPWVVSADEIDDPQDLDLSCSVDGEVRQSSNTRHMIFPIARLLAELSAGLTLLPGDVFLTGTPEGVGMSRTPPAYLRAGQVVESTVSGVGTIRNHII